MVDSWFVLCPCWFFVDLETVDSMISRDDAETTIFLEMTDFYKEMIDSERPDTLLYHYNEIENYWMVFEIFCRQICYATVAGAIRNGVAPW